jgi:geranylgeranyl diphosphate synthase type II
MPSKATSFSSVLDPYRLFIEKALRECIVDFGEKTPLRDACEYALMNGGKRFRPALVLMIAGALGNRVDVTQAALGVEFFHTASLIADDLPCMDDDDTRRHKPSLHKAFGEPVALLTTYALISAGYGSLAKNARVIAESGVSFAPHSDMLCRLALENAVYNTGIFGATGGQFLDILPPDLSWDTLRDVIRKKTVTLFEISFVLGWIFGGGDLSLLNTVKHAAEHFGLAFQIADDLSDREQDIKNNRLINVANICGVEEAGRLFRAEIEQFEQSILRLGIQSKDLSRLVGALCSLPTQ